MNKKIDTAFILAAGLGTRLRPYTDAMPKPMVPINGKSIIARAIEKLIQAGVTKIIVNTHYLSDVLRAHLNDIAQNLPAPVRILQSYEPEILETGGGLKNARPLIGDGAFYILNGDALWDDTVEAPVLTQLAQQWDDSRMDIFLVLKHKDSIGQEEFVGDYTMDESGRLTRALNKDGDSMFAGIRIAHTRILENAPDGPYSFLRHMDEAQTKRRLFGLYHTAPWYHISTPDDLRRVDALFQKEAR